YKPPTDAERKEHKRRMAEWEEAKRQAAMPKPAAAVPAAVPVGASKPKKFDWFEETEEEEKAKGTYVPVMPMPLPEPKMVRKTKEPIATLPAVHYTHDQMVAVVRKLREKALEPFKLRAENKDDPQLDAVN